MADLKDELKDQSFGRAGTGSEKVKGHTLHTWTPGRLAQGGQGNSYILHLLHSSSIGVFILGSRLRKPSLFRWHYVKDKVQETNSLHHATVIKYINKYLNGGMMVQWLGVV